MENASKALLIAGAILLCILIIAIGMFIYNSAQGTIVSSMNSLSTQEVEAFNNQFMTYQGVQKGTNVKKLMQKLIANANTFADEKVKIPIFRCWYSPLHNGITYGYLNESTTIQDYIDMCGKTIGYVKSNHEYYVAFNYQKNGLIDYIHILNKIPENAYSIPSHR